MSKKGAPFKYDEVELKKILMSVAIKFPGQKVTPSLLERETGVKRHVWSRRMDKIIEELNEKPPIETNNVSKLPLPNVIELVEKNWNSKTNLIKSLKHFNETIQSLYEQAKKYYDVVEENKNLRSENESQVIQIKKLKQEADYFKELYMELSVKSTYNLFQEKEGIKKSVISINKNKEKALSTDLVSQFPELFEEED